MKKTVVALACVLISGGAMAASLTHGTTTTFVKGNGNYFFDSYYQSKTLKGGTYTDQDNGTVTVSPHNTIKKIHTNHQGTNNTDAVSQSTWINAGGLVWGDSLGWSYTKENTTSGCIGSCGTKAVKDVSIISDQYTITTVDDGMTTVETVEWNDSFRTDYFDLETSTFTNTNGIFME